MSLPPEQQPLPATPEVRIREVRLLSDDHYILRRTVLDYRRRDGSWQTLVRETYDRGNGAAILPYDPERRVVLLVRQFRFPAWASGHAAPLIEAVGGVIEAGDAQQTAVREVEEEAGLRVRAPRQVMNPFMSPGSVTERVALYVAEYNAADRRSAGGGLQGEGEDIEVLELPFDEALAMVAAGDIIDAKTILLLQHLRLAGVL